MTLSSYLEGLLSNFKDIRIVRNATSLVQNIIEHKSIRLWSISRDNAEFERSKRLLNGSLQAVLDGEKVSDALQSVGSQQMHVKLEKLGKAKAPELLVLLHDPCDIRKEYAAELENLGTVRALDGKLIPGYLTFNTVVVEERRKSPQPFDTSVYSTGDPHYVTEQELKEFHKEPEPEPEQMPEQMQEQEQMQKQERHEEIQRFLDEDSYVNLKRVLTMQLSRVNQQMQTQFPHSSRCHVLDRQFDGVPCFELIGQALEEGSRNSNEEQVDEATGTQTAIKLNVVPFAHHHRYRISTIRLKHRTYQNVTCNVEWDTLRLNNIDDNVVRVTLFDRKARPIFAAPMLLITNMPLASAEDACRIYRLYLLRAKIEGVFKFCKTVLGWEEFQVRDYVSIPHLLALTYFVAGYFYASDSALIDNPVLQLICKLGGAKHACTRYFFLQGIQKLLVYRSVERFKHTHTLEEEFFKDMMGVIT